MDQKDIAGSSSGPLSGQDRCVYRETTETAGTFEDDSFVDRVFREVWLDGKEKCKLHVYL